MDHLLLTRKPIDIGAINELVAHDSCGAISLFVGTTRDNFDGRTVVSLEYEAYEPMALKEMQVICAQLRQKWSDVKNIAIYHRLGLVPVREASVVIGVSSPHRQTALDAVAFAIEELKRRVPIWKKEQYEDDKSAWKENKELTGQLIKRELNLDDCTVQVADSSVVPQNLIQITAKEHEINRRIQCFIQKKREEIDINNIMDFTIKRPKPREGIDAEELSTCTRTDAFIIKQDKSKSILRVRRVKNEYEPQTRPDYGQTLDNFMSDGNTPIKIEQEEERPICNSKQNEDAEERLISDAGFVNAEVTTDETIICPLCSKQFENRSSVNRHIKKNVCKKKKRNFKCDKCNETFSRKSSLKRHTANVCL